MFSIQEKAIKVRAEAGLKRLELQKLMKDRENLDYEAIRASLSEAAKIRQDMFIDQLKLREEIHNVLTPEQQEALKALKSEGPRRGRRFMDNPGSRRGDTRRRFHRREPIPLKK